MGYRVIKDSIKYSKTINDLEDFEEVCFYRLLVSVDDFGRFYRDPMILRNELFPRKVDKTVEDVDNAFEALERVSLIKSYWVSGERYLEIVTWRKHQRIRNLKSKFPAPTDAIPSGSEQELEVDAQLTDSCQTIDGQLTDSCQTDVCDPPPYKSKRKRKGEEEERACAREESPPSSFLSLEEADAIQADHDEIFERLKYLGFDLSPKLMETAISLYAEHGKEKLLQAIDECEGAEGNKLRYLKAVLRDWGKEKPNKETNRSEFADYQWL